MTSDDLSADQCSKLVYQCGKYRQYLAKLRRRMHDQKFPATDPVYLSTVEALDAVAELIEVLDKVRLSRPTSPSEMTKRLPWGGER